MKLTDFQKDVLQVLNKHNIKSPRFAYGGSDFDGRVLYSGPNFDQSELLAAIGSLVEGKWSVVGEYVHRFEDEFSRYLNQRMSVMVNSGSSADLLMVAALKKRFGWADGDKIVVSATGFPTTISSIILNNLAPVFVDIEWTTLNFDLNLVEMAVQQDERIRAIYLSPVLGNPCDMDKLNDICNKHDVELILDGCDSLGSKWKGKHLAEYAIASSCSFFPSHHISTIQGGMISSNDEKIIEIARAMSAWGKGCVCIGAGNLLPNGVCGKRFSCWLTELPNLVVDHRYTYPHIGYNLQPLDMQGAIGLEQIKKIDQIHKARRYSYKRIAEIFSGINSIRLAQLAADHSDPSWFGVPLICEDYDTKRKIVSYLEKNKIQTRDYFAGNILLHDGYKHLGRADLYPHSVDVLKRVFFVGCAPFYTEKHFGHIQDVVYNYQKT